MKYKGFIFDFNGVLWWDGNLQNQAWNQYALKLRGYPLNPKEILTQIRGRNNQDALEYLIGHSLTKDQANKLAQDKESVYRQLCLDQGNNFKLSPGAIELLDWLKNHSVPTTIATASEKTNVDFFRKHLNLDKWFEPEKIVYDDGTHPGKPAPDIYLLAAKNIGVTPQNCVVVEDAKSGIAAAYTAHIRYIIALGSPEKHQLLSSLPGVNKVITSLIEIYPQTLFST